MRHITIYLLTLVLMAGIFCTSAAADELTEIIEDDYEEEYYEEESYSEPEAPVQQKKVESAPAQTASSSSENKQETQTSNQESSSNQSSDNASSSQETNQSDNSGSESVQTDESGNGSAETNQTTEGDESSDSAQTSPSGEDTSPDTDESQTDGDASTAEQSGEDAQKTESGDGTDTTGDTQQGQTGYVQDEVEIINPEESETDNTQTQTGGDSTVDVSEIEMEIKVTQGSQGVTVEIIVYPDGNYTVAMTAPNGSTRILDGYTAFVTTSGTYYFALLNAAGDTIRSASRSIVWNPPASKTGEQEQAEIINADDSDGDTATGSNSNETENSSDETNDSGSSSKKTLEVSDGGKGGSTLTGEKAVVTLITLSGDEQNNDATDDKPSDIEDDQAAESDDQTEGSDPLNESQSGSSTQDADASKEENNALESDGKQDGDQTTESGAASQNGDGELQQSGTGTEGTTDDADNADMTPELLEADGDNETDEDENQDGDDSDDDGSDGEPAMLLMLMDVQSAGITTTRALGKSAVQTDTVEQGETLLTGTSLLITEKSQEETADADLTTDNENGTNSKSETDSDTEDDQKSDSDDTSDDEAATDENQDEASVEDADGESDEAVDPFLGIPLDEVELIDRSEESEDVNLTYAIIVETENLNSNDWNTGEVTFRLSYTVEGEEPEESSVTYYCSEDGDQKECSSVYTYNKDGIHVLQFFLKDSKGKMWPSDSYTVKHDYSKPDIYVTTTDGYGLVITGVDFLSGPVYVSVNGGQKWSQLTIPDSDNPSVGRRAYQATKAMTIKAGSIKVKDAVGNVNSWDEDIKLFSNDDATSLDGDNNAKGSSNTSGMSGMSGMSGSSSSRSSGSSRSVSHAKSSTKLISAYNGVDLVLGGDSMSQLTVGDDMLDLSLYASETDRDEASTFTAQFVSWSPESAYIEGAGNTDTLLLTPDSASASDSYTWVFSGTVYKKLAASGIEYMVMQAGDNSLAVSTSGFSGGTRYAMYRSSGMVSKDFTYAVTMDAASGAFQMDVTVDGTTYRMSDDQDSDFYYYDVYSTQNGGMNTLAREGTEG